MLENSITIPVCLAVRFLTQALRNNIPISLKAWFQIQFSPSASDLMYTLEVQGLEVALRRHPRYLPINYPLSLRRCGSLSLGHLHIDGGCGFHGPRSNPNLELPMIEYHCFFLKSDIGPCPSTALLDLSFDLIGSSANPIIFAFLNELNVLLVIP